MILVMRSVGRTRSDTRPTKSSLIRSAWFGDIDPRLKRTINARSQSPRKHALLDSKPPEGMQYNHILLECLNPQFQCKGNGESVLRCATLSLLPPAAFPLLQGPVQYGCQVLGGCSVRLTHTDRAVIVV